MKKILLSLIVITVSVFLFAQTPNQFKYQAVLRNTDGTIMAEESVTIIISILKSDLTTSVFEETHNITTTTLGLINLNIGSKEDLSVVDWTLDEYFIEISVNETVIGTNQLSSVPYALHAKTAETISEHKYQIGDFAQGGIVFWLDETGEHGLVCAKTDQDGGSGVRWYAGTSGNTQAKGDGPYAGEANTAIIIAAQVAIGDDGNTYAARICNELQITESSKTYGDWYLPAKQELNLMYQNRGTINATATVNGGVAFVASTYWNSTEYNNYHVWSQRFSDGVQLHNHSSGTHYVRAIRTF
ncbi:MAG: DUF1566 domain-containing protein [Bacteroidales bacterium]|nr:DUF1566 domain-containing protein [Bacteroidales bacterium]